MMIDASSHPLVRVLERNTTPLSPEAQIEALLDRNEPFVIMMKRPSDAHPDDTSETRRSRSRFFKDNKGRLQRLCAAAVLIEGGRPVAAPIRAMAWALSKAFGVPFHFVADEPAGIRVAARYVPLPDVDPARWNGVPM